jgi:hypothetical protein
MFGWQTHRVISVSQLADDLFMVKGESDDEREFGHLWSPIKGLSHPIAPGKISYAGKEYIVPEDVG